MFVLPLLHIGASLSEPHTSLFGGTVSLYVLYVCTYRIPYSRENNDRLFYPKIAPFRGTDYVG